MWFYRLIIMAGKLSFINCAVSIRKIHYADSASGHAASILSLKKQVSTLYSPLTTAGGKDYLYQTEPTH